MVVVTVTVTGPNTAVPVRVPFADIGPSTGNITALPGLMFRTSAGLKARPSGSTLLIGLFST